MPLISGLPAGENYSRRSRIFSEENRGNNFPKELFNICHWIQPFGVGNFPKTKLRTILCRPIVQLLHIRFWLCQEKWHHPVPPWRSPIFYRAAFSHIFHLMGIWEEYLLSRSVTLSPDRIWKVLFLFCFSLEVANSKQFICCSAKVSGYYPVFRNFLKKIRYHLVSGW